MIDARMDLTSSKHRATIQAAAARAYQPGTTIWPISQSPQAQDLLCPLDEPQILHAFRASPTAAHGYLRDAWRSAPRS
jgi:hypothetical protein